MVTRAVLRLFPAPKQRATALLAFPDLASMVAFGTFLREEAGEFLSGLEFFSELGMSLLSKHLPELVLPLETHGAAYLLVELASSSRHVPPGAIARFVEAGAALCEGILPDVRINPFGHLGDGNIHYNLSPPEGRDGFDGKGPHIGEALARLATGMGGSFAAEHGLGRTKTALADAIRSPEERALMARLKAAMDPSGTMNPGVLVDAAE
ncbi:MAG: FAD-linked oxidase [Xanthobacteraceae bacterium]|nr:FAD-linked oxidase [Xanthobacteraceae bacterium]MDF2998832.1 FAD-linked oxidase [Xanthobacteraceae bacterium]